MKIDKRERYPVEEPLLFQPEPDLLSSSNRGEEEPLCGNYWACVFNLTKGVLGAGMMALPRAVSLLGFWLGVGLLWLVASMTWISISRGIVHPVLKLLGWDTVQSRIPDYSGLVRSYMGNAVRLFNILFIANALGFSVMFLDITADVLLGTDAIPGVLPDLLATLQAPSYLCSLLLNRHLFLALYTLLVVAPVCLRRDMASLGSLNVAGLIALAAFGLSLAWLSVAVIMQGTAHPLPAWPDLAAFATGGSSAVGQVLSLMTVLPVVLTASGCHLNILPLAGMMKPFNRKSMDSVVAVALALTTFFYILMAIASYTVFGEAIEEDILKNINPATLQDIVGPVHARLISYTVRIAYVISLLGSTGLNNFPLREAILDVFYGNSWYKEAAREKNFALNTGGILLTVYLLAAAVPSIWQVIGFVGSVTATNVSFIFPAIIMYLYGTSTFVGKTKTLYQSCAIFILFVGAGIMANGVIPPLLQALMMTD
ncbi:hypothetical protein CEUSTIGMA_g11253.t1 [Chlamydomonas eustigma]|uniref:Amino acid transporter transmembrane domain-containing protein n=1 Tax=Chlamydomonas eustigma TaxID=1157962 RepID=A0A250XLM1_9CHLO|nr:hypothetical protein CEUSTIGMA_g11253.t1 [Chlamydomonas eustigma]|eukprot:GAX83829.1 hypothetical protein CEUSTIGMA_g11253.t1 [Chlamydomonas eustigma]